MYICINCYGRPFDAYSTENTSFINDSEVIDIIRAGKVLRYTGRKYSVKLVRSDVRTLTDMGYNVAM